MKPTNNRHGVVIVFISACMLLWSCVSNTSLQPQQYCTNTEAVTANAIATVNPVQVVQDLEYNISAVHLNNYSHQAPNRAQNLRSSFSQTNWTITPRSSTAIPWEFNLSLLGIYADAKKVTPTEHTTATVKNNDLCFTNNNYSIEYKNNKDGIEQTFVIHTQPAKAARQLQVKLKYKKGWQANAANNEITFTAVNMNKEKLVYNKLKVWDATGKILAAKMQVENDAVVISAYVAAAVYPITIDPTISSASWGVELNQAASALGCSIYTAGDVNGDGLSDIIVGANKFDNTFTDEGAAFVFLGGFSGIASMPTRSYYGGQAGAEFGSSVSTAADVNGDGYGDVLIGAPKYDSTFTDEGKVVAYYGGGGGICAGGSLSYTPNWIAVCGQANANFGYSIAGVGDVNNDGYSDILIGAPKYDNGETDEGAVFYYRGHGPKPCFGAGGGLDAAYTNLLEVNQANANFGVTVAGAGDVNGDLYYDIIIGANLYDNGQTDEGAAFVWHGKIGTLNTAYNLLLEENQAGSNFGISVSTAGDTNGDGYADVLVGASLYSNAGNADNCDGTPGPSRPLTENGRAFMYPGAATGVTIPPPASKWFREGKVNYSHFGFSVACAGDVNADGFSDVIIGAPDYDELDAACAVTVSRGGRVYIYEGGAPTFGLGSAQFRGLYGGGSANVNLGYNVAPAGDINGDGFSDVIFSSINFTNGQANEGKVFALYGQPYGLDAVNSDIDWQGERNQVSAWHGTSVASAGDVNGDGIGDVIIGSQLFDNTLTNEGGAFVHYGTTTGISTTAAWSVYGGQNTATLGWSVAGAGDVNGDGYCDVIVSAYQHDDGGFTDNGKVSVYFGSAAGLSATANWTKSGTASSQHFGYSVACAGDVNLDGYSDIIIGAPQYSNGQSNEGGVFVYKGSASGPAATVTWTKESDQANARFGASVACAGDVNGDGFNDVAIGAPNYNNTLANEGRVYVYHGTALGLQATATRILNGGVANAQFGFCVSTAGDINADAYSDIIIGAPYFTQTGTSEGRAQVYNGSVTGTAATASWSVRGGGANLNLGYSVAGGGDFNGDGYSDVIVGLPGDGKGRVNTYPGSVTGLATTRDWTSFAAGSSTNSSYGFSVSGAGDVNGDGYSDAIAGAPLYTNGQTNEGAVRVFYGNEKQNVPNNIWLLNHSLTAIIDRSNINYGNYGISYKGRSFLGRNQGRIAWELKKQGVPFESYTGLPISKRTTITGKQSIFVSIPVAGYTFTQQVAKPNMALTTKTRVRMQYPAVSALTGQVLGPWRYIAAYMQGGLGYWSLPLPIDIISFNAIKNNSGAVINWELANTQDNAIIMLERSTNGNSFETITQYPLHNKASAVFNYADNNLPVTNKIYYRLKIISADGKVVYSKVCVIGNNSSDISIIDRGTEFYIAASNSSLYIVTDAVGRIISNNKITTGFVVLDKKAITTRAQGLYFLTVVAPNGERQVVKFINQ